MQTHNNNTNNQSYQNINPNMSSHKPNNTNNSQTTYHNSIIQCSIKNNKRTIPRKVKKEPRDEKDQENNHGNRVPKKAEEDDEEDCGGVVELKVG